MSKTIKLTTGEAIVKFLTQQYIAIDGEEHRFVEGVMNIFGHGNVLGLGEALSHYQDDLTVIQGKNEQGMTHVATGFAKQSLRQKIFAVTSSVGPGSANLVTAAATALANHIPVLLLPGDTFATRQPDPVLQQIEHDYSSGVTTNDALKPVSRYFDRITRPEQIMSALLRAFEVMTNPATAGPVTLALSQDVQGEAFDFPTSFFKKRVYYVDRIVPSDRALTCAAEALNKAERPLLIVGGGAKYSEAQHIIDAISTTHELPFVETQAGKSTLLSNHPNNLGGIGVTGIASANIYAQTADVIVGIGTKYSDFTTSSKTAFDFEYATFININVRRPDALKLGGIDLVGDAKATLTALSERLTLQPTRRQRMDQLKAEWQQERTRLSHIDPTVHDYQPEIQDDFSRSKFQDYVDALKTSFPQTNALIALNEAVADDAIIVAAAGSLPGDLERLWETTAFNTYHMEYGYSTMGYEIAAALGAKLAHPDREVYALVGDGSFLMLHSELITALQYEHKINVVVFDNSGFGCINNLQMGNGSDSFCTEFTTASGGILNIDYQKVAEGYGAKAYKVHTQDALIQAIEDAKKCTTSTLIEIKTLPKTMTDGYASFWNVGVSEVSDKAAIQEALKTKRQAMQNAKLY
ncbi:3D-(3,5/4)-trihydroxycyclohexane-1,2-dione acylhydrolase (decyclizing) [Staphylococcus agnetis]|uniref:3D-(3,5/4)-trihydroxycyclohexane-1,2-dione acylhydrolase (decyclizing) n=1 Tax=Staphylococcus agnetis TaxID=985762 RepID=UPI000D1A86C8|nr:3D-(3,5/4)-trihydroxycyclohexane-1,2-dione acylhydrolase (decyclizing) [Staphylococcus agnetis]MCO4325710.1 3D-(3,5/4)-trihydroxycyclohexane-1,2-dione acylhydrolase (decyclizing) [Staphylococcus agnetis]MCO4356545.1 3D-(3,5/4)-trihydroxycyclohexane-1,2-dione acylhydrolase (decyclizing) [Staphylococcus agnetis]MCO4362776.1 3D-(3,5/4)-trihydroxycyclohexane-1,2-dione acylhydrolase (decyclizing) [Staphylococcus agnetis]MCO4369886.1 3D-(3,5/4)-trihydroxycyclohexane-1,2-dione acylhydrolase (decycl